MNQDRHRKMIKSIVARAHKAATKKLEALPCIVPGCTRPPIMSHSQQKARELTAIAEQGHVLALDRDPLAAFAGRPLLGKRGINVATTFPGFCGDHDRDLLKAAETGDMRQPTPAMATCLGLRAVAYEVRAKQKALFLFREFYKELSLVGETVSAQMVKAHIPGVETFLAAEGRLSLEELLHLVSAQRSARCAWYKIPTNVGASVTCTMTPLFELYEELSLEGASAEVVPLLAFSLIPEAHATHVCFTWLERDDAFCGPFMDATPVDAVLINRLAFGESEDTTLRPSLWTGASAEEKQRTLAAIREVVSRSQLDDGEVPRLLEWGIEAPELLFRC